MMTQEKSYETSVKINCTPEQAFKSLTMQMGDWWGDQDQPAQKVGDIFIMSWGGPWYQFKVVESMPNQIIGWECIDANQIIGNLEGVQKEWVGTKLIWTITEESENSVRIHFIHQGLVPEFICYDVCSTTWERFITFNLKRHLES